MKNLKSFLLFFMAIISISHGKNKECYCQKYGVGWSTNNLIDGTFDIQNIKYDTAFSSSTPYSRRVCQDEVKIYVCLEKEISKNQKILIDEVFVLKQNLGSDYTLADMGEYTIGDFKYRYLPAIVKKTDQYNGEFYSTIYKVWYFNLKTEKIIEIKLPSKTLKVIDQSHDD